MQFSRPEGFILGNLKYGVLSPGDVCHKARERNDIYPFVIDSIRDLMKLGYISFVHDSDLMELTELGRKEYSDFQNAGMDEIVRLTEELGLYDD